MTNAEVNAKIEAIEERGGNSTGGIDHHHQQSNSGANFMMQLNRMKEMHNHEKEEWYAEKSRLEGELKIQMDKIFTIEGDLTEWKKKYHAEVTFAKKQLLDVEKEFEDWKRQDAMEDSMRDAIL